MIIDMGNGLRLEIDRTKTEADSWKEHLVLAMVGNRHYLGLRKLDESSDEQRCLKLWGTLMYISEIGVDPTKDGLRYSHRLHVALPFSLAAPATIEIVWDTLLDVREQPERFRDTLYALYLDRIDPSTLAAPR